jgi:hypothetical protein
MSNSVVDFWDSILASSSIENHCHYKLTELDNIPEMPGIYAWYLSADQNNFLDYYKVYKQKKVEVNIQGNLSELYVGDVKNTYYEKDFKDNGVDHDLCSMASLAFSPPLYIGISKNLQKRLKDHSSELKKIFFGQIPLNTPPPVGKTDFDTIVESRHFAQRIGHTIKSFSNININSLLIKTIEMDSTYLWTDLQKVERYLNRTYIPIYGRK